jgi:hypothetical protein
LFLILLSYPAVSGVADDTVEPGRSNPLNFPLFNIRTGSNPDSGAAKEEKEEGVARNGDKREKQIRDKKVDDAIKKAWEEK